MYTDIVGYTGMMQKDEPGTLLRLEEHRSNLEKTVGEHLGYVHQYFGDGSLIIFNSVFNAILCSIKIQEHSHRAGIPLRIGMHVGEILIKEGVIFGDGLNIASRIESLGVRGSILISESVYEQIHNQPDIKVKALGRFKLKNVQLPVRIFSVTNNGFPAPEKAQIWMNSKSNKKCRPLRSLKVIFNNMSDLMRKKG
jgi:class 3 adenylate cyclase